MWKFIKSSSNKENWLIHNQIEICFIGRSNVGKSTLINNLASHSKLAKTSKTPGRTQLINYFQTDKNIIVVDLPGYGFANISKVKQEKMFYMIDQYFTNKKPEIVFVLIDSRCGILKQDEDIIKYLIELKHNVVLIITKIDKSKQKELAQTLKHHYFQEFKYFLSEKSNLNKMNKIKNFIYALDEGTV